MVERRLTWLALAILLWGAAIFYKLISLQVVHHQEYALQARKHQEEVRTIPAPRGTIFDRNGQPLAMSIPTEFVYVNPLKVPDIGVAADILSQFLHLERVELYGRLKNAQENNRGYLIIKKNITFDEGQHLPRLLRDQGMLLCQVPGQADVAGCGIEPEGRHGPGVGVQFAAPATWLSC